MLDATCQPNENNPAGIQFFKKEGEWLLGWTDLLNNSQFVFFTNLTQVNAGFFMSSAMTAASLSSGTAMVTADMSVASWTDTLAETAVVFL